MATLPWTTVSEAADGDELVAMASRFRLTSLRAVPRFFIEALRVRRQVMRTPGAVGVSLIAHPLRREFFTLSVWRDQSAIDHLVRADPHHAVMRRQHPKMAGSAFVFWNLPGNAMPPSWDDARQRLSAAPVKYRDDQQGRP
jgi:Domain of unknown function (DUF3291)